MTQAPHSDRPFEGIVRSLGLVLTGVALFGLASGGLFPAIGLQLERQGISDYQIGLVSSAYFLGALIGTLCAERLIRRISHTRAFAVLAAVAGIATLVMAGTSSFGFWTFLRLVTGFCLGGYYVVVESWINHASANASRGRSLAIYESVHMIAIAASPFVLQLGTGPEVIGLASIFFVAAIIPVAFSGFSEPRLPRLDRSKGSQIIAAGALPVAGCFVAGLVSGSFYGLGAVYGARIGLSTWQVSLFVSVVWIAPLATQLAVGAIADRANRRWVISGASIIAGSSALGVAAFWDSNFLVLLGLVFTVGGMSHPIYALSLSIANDRLGGADNLRAAVSLLVAYNTGTFLGPVLASIAMAWAGPNGLYVFFAVCLLPLGVGSTAMPVLYRTLSAPKPKTGPDRTPRRTWP